MASCTVCTALLSALCMIYLPCSLSAKDKTTEAIEKYRYQQCYERCVSKEHRFPCEDGSWECGDCLFPITTAGPDTCTVNHGSDVDMARLLDEIVKRDQGTDGIAVDTADAQPEQQDETQPAPDQPAADSGAEINQANPDLAGKTPGPAGEVPAAVAAADPLTQEEDSNAEVQVQEPQPQNGSVILLAEWQFILIVCGCVAVAIIGVAVAFICWYKIQTTSKAQNEAEYPAYGVTGPGTQIGPTMNNGDRKLAQSAQMYHYQHQKQQMIAMEKREKGEVQRDASDYDSEEENEDGDLTVYECPGLAPTGEMQVKNPLFAEDAYPKPPAEEGDEEKQ